MRVLSCAVLPCAQLGWTALMRASAPRPNTPVTKSSSPGRTPCRRSAFPATHPPTTVTSRLQPRARERLPPTKGQPTRAPSATKPRTIPSKSDTSPSAGAHRLSKAPTGRAPIAARSERFTDIARRPIVLAPSRPNRKCVPSTWASTESTSSSPLRGRNIAASSPIRSAQSRPGVRPAKREIRAIRADSPTSARVLRVFGERGIKQT